MSRLPVPPPLVSRLGRAIGLGRSADRVSGHESRHGRVGVDLSTRVGSVALSGPVLTASGTAGHGAELAAFIDVARIGAVVIKSVSADPWGGNPPVRVHQTPAGMINSVGLQGMGVAAWLADDLPPLLDAGAKVVASIWGRSVDDYARAATLLAGAPAEVVAVEVNISCPNTEAGNELFAHDAAMTREVLAATESAGRPRWAKLSPNIGPGLPDIAGAAAEGGAEAVVVANTWFGLAIDPVTRRPRLGGGAGGVSGRGIHPLTVRAVHVVRQAHPDLPIVAAGGVATVEDVVEFALVGASAVEVGTAHFDDPRICERLTTDLDRWCARQGIKAFAQLIGSVRM